MGGESSRMVDWLFCSVADYMALSFPLIAWKRVGVMGGSSLMVDWMFSSVAGCMTNKLDCQSSGQSSTPEHTQYNKACGGGGGGGGGCGFFLGLGGFGENIRQFIPRLYLCFVCLFLFVCLFVIFLCLVEISSRTLIPLFMLESVHSGSASWDDCGRMFLDKLRVSSFPDRFPHYAWTAE